MYAGATCQISKFDMVRGLTHSCPRQASAFEDGGRRNNQQDLANSSPCSVNIYVVADMDLLAVAKKFKLVTRTETNKNSALAWKQTVSNKNKIHMCLGHELTVTRWIPAEPLRLNKT